MELVVRTDGGSRGNPGPAAAGVHIADRNGRILFSGGFFLGEATNNVAEYQGILHGLAEAKKLGGTRITLYCDSELVTRQLNGQYRVKNAAMRRYYDQVCELRAEFEQFEIIHVRREKNADADAMVNEALDCGADVGGACDVKDLSESIASGSRDEGLVEKLADKVMFSDKGACRVMVSQAGGLRTELICLRQGQKDSLVIDSTQASVVVFQGQGILQLGERNAKVRRGDWLTINKGQELGLQADRDSDLVVLVTVVV